MKYARKFFEIVGLVTVLSAVGLAIFLPFLAVWLQPQDTPERADYIVVLGGDDHRYIKAIELFKQDLAPVILLSNDRVPPKTRITQILEELGYPYLNPYEFRLKLLRHYGIPERAVQSFGGGSVSTGEEAEALRKLLGDRQARVILVTSPFQARRAKLIFQQTMPNTRFFMVYPPEGTIDPSWWRDQQSAILAVLETTKIGFFWLGGVFRASPN